MAKKIQISSDGGSTWNDVPSPQGSVEFSAEEIDDTILGQTYQSNEVGLISWSVSAQGIFKGFAGYLAELKEVGTAVSTTGEAFSNDSGQVYSVNDATKEIWDRSATVTIYDNASPVAAANIEDIDYLFGRVTFAAGYSVTGPVTADFDYFPTQTLGKGNSYTLTMSAESIDETDFPTAQANGGYRVFTAGLRTVALEMGGIFDASTGARATLAARNEIIIEVDPAGDGSSICRGFFKLTSESASGAVGALEEETLNFSLTVPDETTNPQVDLPFNWRHTNTTLSQAIQDAITSWLNELNTYDVRYLPSGATGQSPLDGVEGNVMFTDISLEGGLSNMNTFSVEMQGTGAFTEV